MIFFFFKQKTAYEMRISDWSSDVCSSDLLDGILITTFDVIEQTFRKRIDLTDNTGGFACGDLFSYGGSDYVRDSLFDRLITKRLFTITLCQTLTILRQFFRRTTERHVRRSEEHTSELQSLMRISYAVFCLKKKQKTNTHTQKKTNKQ